MESSAQICRGRSLSIEGHHTDPGTSKDNHYYASYSAKGSRDLLEDLDLRILMERLNLLESQRELSALRCQRFTEELEASLAQHRRGPGAGEGGGSARGGAEGRAGRLRSSGGNDRLRA